MNCVRCDYLLWDLAKCRCPECGLPFEVTDYSFPPKTVAFICNECGESYLGTDENGLPAPRRFSCTQCHAELDASGLWVKPLKDGVIGEPLRMGTPWEQRKRVGFVRAFMDGVSQLAMQPGDFFRLSSAAQDHGEMVFSVLCAYVAAAVLVATLFLLQRGGLIGWLPDLSGYMHGRAAMIAIAAVPLIQIAWNYLYGVLIQVVLAILGQQNSDFESSVRAVAFGSAVLPAVLLLPPIGLLWYINVVSSGVEHLHHTTKGQALIATMIPILAAGNILVIVSYSMFA